MRSGVKILRFPRYKHICLRAPGKCACNAINTLQKQPCYTYTFSVYQRCACNKYLLYTLIYMRCRPKIPSPKGMLRANICPLPYQLSHPIFTLPTAGGSFPRCSRQLLVNPPTRGEGWVCGWGALLHPHLIGLGGWGTKLGVAHYVASHVQGLACLCGLVWPDNILKLDHPCSSVSYCKSMVKHSHSLKWNTCDLFENYFTLLRICWHMLPMWPFMNYRPMFWVVVTSEWANLLKMDGFTFHSRG